MSAPAAPAAPSTDAARDLVSFINASPSPFHAVEESCRRLAAAGFTRLHERDAAWATAPGGKYFVTRNQSSLCAFVVGGRFSAAGGASGFSVAAGHTDSPCLRVKPVSTQSKAGFQSLGVETYGGGIWHTWFDRDLSVAGRAVVAGAGGGFESRLVRVSRPICRIPSLAIHLDRTVNDAFKVNAETHLPPVLATAARAALLELPAPPAPAPGAEGRVAGTGDATTRHHLGFVRLLARELGVAPDAVRDFELSVFDTQPAQLGGLYDEFVFSPRLDNLCMTFSVVEGLIASARDAAEVAADTHVRVAAAFDHEEVGSDSVPGASSTMLGEVMARLAAGGAAAAPAAAAAGALPALIRRSFLVSADMAHAHHPNYPGVHEDNHRPAMHAGLVIKNNCNQRYATTAVTAHMFRELARRAGVPLQDFCVRQDAGCGSTIGPIVATQLGVRTVDVGVAQLSMHSVREMCGAGDVAHAVGFFRGFFRDFPAVDAALANAD